MTTYYSWEADDGSYNGLARKDENGWAVVAQSLEGWAVKPELLGLLLDGDISFVEINPTTASGLAIRYGVKLDQPAQWRWSEATQSFVSLADGSSPESLLTT